jgi:hypothetical protein
MATAMVKGDRWFLPGSNETEDLWCEGQSFFHALVV